MPTIYRNETEFGGSGNSIITTTTIDLTTSGWTNKSKTVTVVGVTTSNLVIISPEATSMDNYTGCEIKCTEQATDSLTFSCTTLPTSTVRVNILIID